MEQIFYLAEDIWNEKTIEEMVSRSTEKKTTFERVSEVIS